MDNYKRIYLCQEILLLLCKTQKIICQAKPIDISSASQTITLTPKQMVSQEGAGKGFPINTPFPLYY